MNSSIYFFLKHCLIASLSSGIHTMLCPLLRLSVTGTSLVVQWLRPRLPMQWAWVQSLVRGLNTCCNFMPQRRLKILCTTAKTVLSNKLKKKTFSHRTLASSMPQGWGMDCAQPVILSSFGNSGWFLGWIRDSSVPTRVWISPPWWYWAGRIWVWGEPVYLWVKSLLRRKQSQDNGNDNHHHDDGIIMHCCCCC